MEKKIKQHLQSELQRANQNATANADLSDIVSSLSGTKKIMCYNIQNSISDDKKHEIDNKSITSICVILILLFVGRETLS